MYIWQDITKEIEFKLAPSIRGTSYHLIFYHKNKFIGMSGKNPIIHFFSYAEKKYKIIGNSFANFKILEKVKKEG